MKPVLQRKTNTAGALHHVYLFSILAAIATVVCAFMLPSRLRLTQKV